MKYRSFKRIDGELSLLGFGAWGISGAFGGGEKSQFIRTVHEALEQGVNFIDTAPVYGLGASESVLGEALQGHRRKVFLASKCGLVWDQSGNVRNDLSPKSLKKEIPEILERLRTDHLDLLQIHWPNPEFPLEATMEALAQFKEKGLVRHIGVCNFSLEDLQKADSLVPISSWQGLYNMFEPNATKYHGIDLGYRVAKQIIPFLSDKGIALLPYSPLMQGLLAGRYTLETSFSEDDVRGSNPKLRSPQLGQYLEIARELRAATGEQYSLLELALGWLGQQEVVGSIIAGVRSPEHLESNVKALEKSLPREIHDIITASLASNPLIQES